MFSAWSEMLYKIGGKKNMEGFMYNRVVAKGLTYGQAMDAVIHEGKKVSREVWRGYWELQNYAGMTTPIIVAVLKDNGGIVPSTAYIEDKLATDWMIVE